MQGFLFVLIFLLSNLVYADNFGDQVVSCAAKYKLPPDSPELKIIFDRCEKELEKGDIFEIIKEFDQCLLSSASLYDDHISPASEIASAVASECESKYLPIVRRSNAEITEYGKIMKEYPSNEVKDMALKAVLISRKTSKKR